MRIVRKRLDELRPTDYNPRRISRDEFEKLKRSIREFGYVEPIVWNRRTGRVVGGHQRLKALRELGYKDVDVVEVDLDEKREMALNVALNRISGGWDEAKLLDVLESLKSSDAGLFELTGFTENELEELKLLREDLRLELDEKDIKDVPTKNKCPRCGYEW